MTYMATWLDRFSVMHAHAIRRDPEMMERDICGWIAEHVNSGGTTEHARTGTVHLLDETRQVVGTIKLWNQQDTGRAYRVLNAAIQKSECLVREVTCLSCYSTVVPGSIYCEEHTRACDEADMIAGEEDDVNDHVMYDEEYKKGEQQLREEDYAEARYRAGYEYAAGYRD